MPLRHIYRPSDPAAAHALLTRTDERVAAAAVSPRMPVGPYAQVEAAVDLGALPLRYVREADTGLHLGALTSLQDLVEAPAVRALAHGVVSEAAELAAHLGLRHAATLGATLMAREGPPELALALGALGAWVVTLGGAELTLADWLAEAEREWPREVRLARPPADLGGALARVARTPRDAALVAAVAVVGAGAGGRGLATVHLGPNPVWAWSTADAGEPWADQLAAVQARLAQEAQAETDYLASAEYRMAMAEVLAGRALTLARQRAGA